MWGVEFPEAESSFIYAIFGLQLHSPNAESRKTQIHALIADHATNLDCVTQQGPGTTTDTQIWLTYWANPEVYQAWWKSDAVQEFWAALPADAGVWRETMLVPPSRTQFGTNKLQTNGLASCANLVPNLDKSGYWGCYRDRLSAASATEPLSSPMEKAPERKASDNTVRRGRKKLVRTPDNICFAVEGQDHSLITAEEQTFWHDNFDGPVTRWMGDLARAGSRAGVLDARLCSDRESGTFREAKPEVLNYNRKIELFYFTELAAMERIAKNNKGHVKLRSDFMAAYCPAGAMGPDGKLTLWVEVSVVKSGDLTAEYIGCIDGTGFLGFEDSDEFEFESSAE